MVPGLSDLNCSNSVRVKLPFLGREDHSKKKERGKWQEERQRNIQCRQRFSEPEKEPETNKTLTSYDRVKLRMETTNKN